MTAITVLGTGAIGAAVARVLLAAGRDVRVWNRTPDRAAELVPAGAEHERDLGAAVASADLVLACLTDHAAVQSLLTGLPRPSGRDRDHERTLVTLTTGSPDEVARTVALAADRGLDCLAAGVQTSPEDVGTARARFVYAGDEEVYARRRDVLDLLGPGHWIGSTPTAAAELDLALFGLWYDAQLGLLRALEMTGRAGVPPEEVATMAATQLQHVVDGVPGTVQEVVTGDYPRGPASLAEHAPVLARLRASRQGSLLGDGGLDLVEPAVTALASGGGAEQGLTALLAARARGQSADGPEALPGSG